MNFKPSEHKDIMQKLNNIIQELEKLKDDNYWAYTKEYWMGLLDCSLIMLKKVVEEMKACCYYCRYWARYPNQPKQEKSDVVDPEYVRLMVQGAGYTDEQREKVAEAAKNFKIKGFCTYWKEDKEHDDTCSGCHLINIER